MRVRDFHKRALLLLALGTALHGCSGTEVSNGQAPLVVDLFEATPSTIVPGEASTLQWTVRGASHVRVTDGLGALLTDFSVRDSEVSGSLSVTPFSTTVYTLDATRGDTTKSAVATVRLFGPDVQPRVIYFEATPVAVVAGTPVMLTWSVFDASRVTIMGNDVEVAVVTDHRQIRDGFLTVMPTEDILYELVAVNPNAENAMNVFVDVRDDPVIDSFIAVPNEVTTGGNVRLSWQTQHASDVTIASSDGTTLLDAVGGPQAGVGHVTVQVAGDTTFSLLANGSWAHAEASVNVAAVPAPVVDTFESGKRSIVIGETTVLSWSVRDAVQVTVSVLGATPLHDSAEQDGQITVSPFSTTEYQLQARNRLGATVTKSLVVSAGGQALTASAIPSSFAPGYYYYEFVGLSELTWDATGADHVSMSSDFDYDIRAMPTTDIASTGTDVGISPDQPATVQPLPFPFTFDGQVYTELMISYFGFLTFELSGGGNNSYTCDVSAEAPNAFIAPLWNNSYTYLGRVLVETRGSPPNRQFIVQWDGMQDVLQFGLTFQAVLNEDGSAELHYPVPYPLRNSTARGFVGMENRLGSKRVSPYCGSGGGAVRHWAYGGDPVYLPRSAFSFGEDMPVTGSRRVLANALYPYVDPVWDIHADYNGTRVSHTVPLQMLAGDELAISEIMYDPEYGVLDSDGEWFELYNRGSRDIDLNGWVMDGMSIPHTVLYTIATPLVVPAGQRIVLGVNDDITRNGGVVVDHVYPRLPGLELGNVSGGVMLRSGGLGRSWQDAWESVGAYATYDELTTPAGDLAGVAAVFPRACVGLNGSPLADRWCCFSGMKYCSATTPMADGSNLGTPGALDDRCGVGDSCSDAMSIDLSSGSVTLSDGIYGVGNQVDIPACPAAVDRPERFYAFDVAEPGTLLVHSEGATDLQAAVWRGACDGDVLVDCSPLTAIDTASETRVWLEAGSYHMALERNSVDASAYRICGAFVLDVSIVAPFYTKSVAVGAFEDISQTGTPLPTSDDAAFGPILLGFSMPVMDGATDSVGVNTNGMLTILGDASSSSENRALGNRVAPFGTFAPFWDDLVPRAEGTLLHYESRGLPGMRRFIVQWSGWDVYNNAESDHRDDALVTFQVVLHEAGDVAFAYEQLEEGITPGRALGASATVGIEGPDGWWAASHLHNEALLSSGTAVTFTRR